MGSGPWFDIPEYVSGDEALGSILLLRGHEPSRLDPNLLLYPRDCVSSNLNPTSFSSDADTWLLDLVSELSRNLTTSLRFLSQSLQSTKRQSGSHGLLSDTSSSAKELALNPCTSLKVLRLRGQWWKGSIRSHGQFSSTRICLEVR